MVGLSVIDPLLGYKPNPGFNGIIHHSPGWHNVYVSLTNTDFVVMSMTII